MDSAYAAARAALFEELTQIVPRVLDLRDGERFGPGLFNEMNLAIHTETAPLGGLPFLSLMDRSYRRRGPGDAIQQLHRALRLLVRDRIWREGGGPSPPAGLFKTNRFTNLVCLAERVSPQELLDMVWESVDIHDGWSESREWQSCLPLPEVMKQSPVAQRQIRHTPDMLPWVAGYVLHDEIAFDAISIIPDGAVYRLTRFGPTEIRLPVTEGTSFHDLAEGQPIGDIAWEDVPLRNWNRILIDDLRYAGSLSIYKRSIRLIAEGESLWEKAYFHGHEHDEIRAEFNKRIRQLFLKRARIEATIVKHLQPFAGPPEDVRDFGKMPDGHD